MISRMLDAQIWEEYYQYKVECGNLPEYKKRELKKFIEEKQYIPVVEKILKKEGFAPPQKKLIGKKSSQKKRVVYVYEMGENYVLKLLNYLLQRKYDGLFAHNLYSFRPKTGAKEAIFFLVRQRKLSKKWSYKVDISNYFNSIPINLMLERLRKNLKDEDLDAYEFIASLLINPWVIEKGKVVAEEKGIMAGTPISTFLANVYLNHMDHQFAELGKLYARYSDDIIVFDDTEELLQEDVKLIHDILEESGLEINQDKEIYTKPQQQWIFLGVSYQEGIIDVSPVSVEKLKAKMRRKMRALDRWSGKKQVSGIHAARVFVKVFNRKLFENDSEHELTWVRWYFPLINTVESLRQIDNYCQNCIRYLATGKHTKAAYNFRYEDIKELGYRSLVNEYYKHRKETE